MVEPHLTSEQMSRFAAGTTSPAEREAMLAHCEDCAPCGDRLAVVLLVRTPGADVAQAGGSAASGLGVARAGGSAAPSPGVARAGGGAAPSRRRWTTAVAAAVFLAIAVYALVRSGVVPAVLPTPFSGPEIAEPPSAERQALTARWALFASDENIPPLIYGFIHRVVYPDTVLTFDADHVPLVKAALVELERGNYEAAIRRFRDLTARRPGDEDLAGWLGIALYLAGDTGEEVEANLRRGTESHIQPVQRHSVWYLSQHMFRVGQPEEGVLWLLELVHVPVAIGRKATELFERLPLDELDLREAAQRETRLRVK